MHIIRRALAVAALALMPLGLVPAVAHADPEDAGGQYAGSGVVGRVTYRGVNKGDCEGPALYVVNDDRNNSAVRSMGPDGMGWVCVRWPAYHANPVGSIWTGNTGRRGSGPVG